MNRSRPDCMQAKHPTVRLFQRFIADERGASAIEYALLAAFIAIVIAMAMDRVGVSAGALYQAVGSCLRDAAQHGRC